MINPKGYQDHIESLARQLGVTLVQEHNMAGMMFVEEDPPRIEGPTIETDVIGVYPNVESKYMVMLHELGHCVWGHTQGRPPHEGEKFYFINGVLKSEAQAWEWALDNRLEARYACDNVEQVATALSKTTRDFCWGLCLNSYLHGQIAAKGLPGQRLGNGNRHHVAFTYDEPDEFFWGIKTRLLNGY